MPEPAALSKRFHLYGPETSAFLQIFRSGVQFCGEFVAHGQLKRRQPRLNATAMQENLTFRTPPARAGSPVLVTVPHAGRIYPEALLAQARVDAAALLPFEDRYADLMTRAVEASDHAVMTMGMARAWIDLNRGEDEIDPAVIGIGGGDLPMRVTAKVRGGLGLIPTRLAGTGPLWKGPLAADDVRMRIETVHRPWHNQIAATLAEMQARFGQAVLIDLHSMPPVHHWRQPGPVPRIVIGDRYGQSAATGLILALEDEIRATGLSVSRNHPYPGGYTLDRHGRPAQGIHAVQIEVDRSLYLDKVCMEPGAGLATAQKLIARLVDRANAFLSADWPLAAE
jgi:N-formylglutamate amidohydrolase